MPFRKILRLICPLILVICLGIGFATTGLWIAATVMVFSLLAWLLVVKWSLGFPPSWALVFSVSLAAAGLLTGAVPLLMLLGAALALVSWDVVLWDRSLTNPSASTSLTLFEMKHYQSLGLALGLGLLAILAGRLFHFQISFGWMVVLVIFALFSLERIRHTLID